MSYRDTKRGKKGTLVRNPNSRTGWSYAHNMRNRNYRPRYRKRWY